jgi:hypothetical protein
MRRTIITDGERGLVVRLPSGWLKNRLLAEADIERSDRRPLEMLHTLTALGERYPDIASEVYIVARSTSGSARS